MIRDPLKEPKFGDVFVYSTEPSRPVMFVRAMPNGVRGWCGIDLTRPETSLLIGNAYFNGPFRIAADKGEWSVVEAAP